MNKKQQTTRSLPQEGKDKDDTGSSLAELAHIEIVSTFSLWIKKRWETIKVPTEKRAILHVGRGLVPWTTATTKNRPYLGLDNPNHNSKGTLSLCNPHFWRSSPLKKGPNAHLQPSIGPSRFLQEIQPQCLGGLSRPPHRPPQNGQFQAQKWLKCFCPQNDPKSFGVVEGAYVPHFGPGF